MTDGEYEYREWLEADYNECLSAHYNSHEYKRARAQELLRECLSVTWDLTFELFPNETSVHVSTIHWAHVAVIVWEPLDKEYQIFNAYGNQERPTFKSQNLAVLLHSIGGKIVSRHPEGSRRRHNRHGRSAYAKRQRVRLV